MSLIQHITCKKSKKWCNEQGSICPAEYLVRAFDDAPDSLEDLPKGSQKNYENFLRQAKNNLE